MSFTDEATLTTRRKGAVPRSRWMLPLAGCGCAFLLLASIRGAAQTPVLNPVALRTTLDELNLTEVAGVPENALEGVFEDITVATDNTLRVLNGETLASQKSVTLVGAIVGASSPLAMDDGSGAEFVTRADGVVTRVHLLSLANVWSISVRRGSCGADSIGTSPAVHMRRGATDAFKLAYSTDIVYVGTQYEGCGASSTSQNKVYALRATTGDTVWAFNETFSVSMDTVSGVVLDGARMLADGSTVTHWRHGDTLFVTSERTASVSQHSVWAIDVLTGQLHWSANYGRFNAPPALSPLYSDRLYVANRVGELKALRKSDGTEIWSLDTGVHFLKAMAVSRNGTEQRIALVDFEGRVWMARDNGFAAEWLWQTELPIGPVPLGTSTIADLAAVSTPVIDGSGNFYVGAANASIYQLDKDTGVIEASRPADLDPSALVQEMALHSTDAGITTVLVSATSAGQVAKHDLPFCQPGACLDDDSDGDGVGNDNDACPASVRGEPVNSSGCTIAQLVPCDGPLGLNTTWRNHRAYVSAVKDTAALFYGLGLISKAQLRTYVAEAQKSTCGA